jgi:ketosteroid isomerase-like protein
MSQENVDVVRKQFEAVNARDFTAAMDAYTEDVTLAIHGDAGPLSGTADGKSAVGDWFGDWFTQFGPDYQFEIEVASGAGERVFLVATHHAHGRTSGVSVERRMAYIYTVREGKVSGVELWFGDFATVAAALDAIGLPE